MMRSLLLASGLSAVPVQAKTYYAPPSNGRWREQLKH